mmetsp:Transcript_100910/g.289646  ORF Transcript_100910/g.289646 Transcript_100910/m.289646 type:complete len:333 (-) Transcript_100910:359-1357(-)
MRSMSASERPPLLRTVTDCFLPVDLSTAPTFTTPLASMSKETSIWGTPRGAGGRPTRSNWPSSLLSAAISRSPWKTLMPTCVWLSAAVEKVCAFLVGIVVFLGMRIVATPPRVSTPKESGETSKSTMSLTSPAKTPACTAAPTATTSSGFTLWFGSLPLTSDLAKVWIAGMRVEPPTRTISLMSLAWSLASFKANRTGFLQRVIKLPAICSNFARLMDSSMCLGPVASAVMKGREILASLTPESSIFAFSAASVRRCSACLSFSKSMPSTVLNSAASQSTITLSKSSPPRWVSPLVDSTSQTPSPTSSTETSKVPPPRSKTMMVSLFFFSRP